MIISIMKSMTNQKLDIVHYLNVILLKTISQFIGVYTSMSSLYSMVKSIGTAWPSSWTPLTLDFRQHVLHSPQYLHCGIPQLKTVSLSLFSTCQLGRSQDLFPNASGLSLNSLLPSLYVILLLLLNAEGTGKVPFPNIHQPLHPKNFK